MFIQYSVNIHHPIQAVGAALVAGAPKWFPRLRGSSLSTVGLRIAGVPVRKRVAIEIGEPVSADTWTAVPIKWKATFPKQLFPTMVGKIEVARVDPEVTKLTVSGSYEPPIGRLGKQFDDSVMRTVAEATIKELSESIAKRLNVVAATHPEM
jgi:hypothetical protein